MSPLRCPAKAQAPRSLIAVSIRLVQRYARGPCVARELQFKSHFKGETKRIPPAHSSSAMASSSSAVLPPPRATPIAKNKPTVRLLRAVGSPGAWDLFPVAMRCGAAVGFAPSATAAFAQRAPTEEKQLIWPCFASRFYKFLGPRATFKGSPAWVATHQPRLCAACLPACLLACMYVRGPWAV
jgi:hypothetical protein